jgi:hypothetical protein
MATDYIAKVETYLEKAEECQRGLHDAWRSSKKDLIDVYDKRTSHCIAIAEMYWKLNHTENKES